jgi:putative glutamine amidotransferase
MVACLALGLALGPALGLPLAAQPLERFLDQPRPTGDGVRLVIFNPIVHNLRGLVALRAKGILVVPGLTVIGVFHVRQKEDFEAARKFVQENHLDWIKFHAVSAEISEPEIFRRNACTPEVETILEKADGIIFFGGSDIPATVFHQKTSLLTEVEDPFRNYLELSAIFQLLGGSPDPSSRALLNGRPGFPILGICLGFQSLNVGTGGSLIQDIWSDFYGKTTVEDAITLGPEQWHSNPYRRLAPLDKLMAYNFHSLQLKDQGKFTQALGFKPTDHPRVLSSHHQALGELGSGWVSIATSRDGKVVEAIEHRRFPNVLGIQFHIEHPLLWETEPRFRQKPGEPLTSYHAILAGSPPSLAFNRAIWTWFGHRLQESRKDFSPSTRVP